MEQKKTHYEEEKMNLSRCTKFGYGLGHVLNDLCSSLWFTYSLIFYNLVLNFQNVNAGAIMLIGQVADAVSTPVIGVLSDRTSLLPTKYGKRKAWHFVGTVCVVAAMPFMYSPCIECEDAAEWKRLIYYAFFVIVFQFGWACVQTAHLALVPDLSTDAIERTDLLSIRNSFTFLATLLTYSVMWVILDVNKDSDNLSNKDVFKFQIIAYALVIAGSITTLVFYLTVKEEVLETPLLEADEERDREPRSERMSFQNMFTRFATYQVAIVYATTRLFVNVSQSFITYYLQKDLQMKQDSIAIIPFIMYVSSFLSSWITTPVIEHFGRRVAFTLGAFIGLGACAWVWIGTGLIYKTYFIYVVAVLFGAAVSILLVTSLAITADLIGNDVGNSAFLYGVMSFADKLTCGTAIMVIQSFYDKNNDHYYTQAIVYVCGGAVIIGTIFAITIGKRSSPSNIGS